MFYGNNMETIFSGPSFGVRSNFSDDKSGMWMGSAKNDWNLTSSIKMSPFRVKYGYHIKKNTKRHNYGAYCNKGT